ncbi:exocyst complex component exo84, partial [Kickxella alabastrina]
MHAGGRRKSMLRDRQFAPRDTAGSGSHPPGSKYTGDASSGELPSVSLSRLTRSEFQAEEYLKETLKAVPEGGLRQFRKTLEEARKAASKNLQRNVYKNYESFVFISKEISSMERDMQLLRELLHSINQVGGDLMEEDTDAEEEGRVGRRRTMRISMANQNDLFKEQLAKVWASIRDAQRFVPFAPGRHVLGDVRNVAELSPSTMQPRQRVDIVVLSDMLLLAVRTKRGAHAQPALVADRSFALADVSVAEVADSARANNLVRIVNRAETFLFGFRSADAKNEMLLLISHAKAGFFGSEPPPGMPPPVPADPRAQSASLRTRGGAEDGGASRPGAEMLDELDVLIARREFDAATAAVQRVSARAADAPLQPAVRRAVDAHTGELARLILADLLIPCSPRPQVAASVQLLHRLGWDKEAKEAFLASRSSTIKNRTRQLKLEGNTGMYIRELAVVYFRLIRNTCEWYSAFFADPTLVSALIAWVRQEMAGYAVIFRRHVFHEMQKFQVIAGCLNHTLAE